MTAQRPVPVALLDDTRKITAITFSPDPAGLRYEVGGPTNVTAITPYAESDDVIWFAIEIGDRVADRVCARFVVQVIYLSPTETN